MWGLWSSTPWLWVPVGSLLASGFSQQLDAPRSVGSSLLLGTMLVAAVEAMQLLVFSRYSSTTDILVGAVGVAMAPGMVHWMWSQRVFTSESRVRVALCMCSAPWLLLASLHTFALLTVYCTPLSSSARAPCCGSGRAACGDRRLRRCTGARNSMQRPCCCGIFCGLCPWEFSWDERHDLPPTQKTGRVSNGACVAVSGMCVGTGVGDRGVSGLPGLAVPDLTDVVLYLCGAGLGFVLSLQWDKLGVHPAGRVGHPHDLPPSCADGERPVAEFSLAT